MNNLPVYLKRKGRIMMAVIAAIISCALSSCDNAIYDDEGDCDVTYRLKFLYDRNMKWADAFPHEVKSVRLYAFDKTGILVWQHSEKGDILKTDGYNINLPLPAGDYRLIAWCGLDNDGERQESFSVPQARVGETRIEELKCSLYRKHDATGAYSDEKLYPMFHGMIDINLPATDDGGDYPYTMDLTKDTNHVRIILQHLSGEPVDINRFSFRIEEENGLMNYDNSLLPDEMITYWAHDLKSGTAGMGIDDYPEQGARTTIDPSRNTTTSISVAIADLTIARLMAGRKTFLTVRTNDGKTVARVPLADYALLLKDGYDEEMSDQEYLDRQDEYTLTFFLDEDELWIGTSIIINSWKVVLNNVDFE